MVILIGGQSCSGKTLMAQRLMEKYSIAYLSIDHVKMGLIRSGTVDMKVTDSDISLTPKLWKIVREIVKTNVENDQNIIIEGCYIPENWAEDFEDDYLRHICGLYIVLSEKYLLQHYVDCFLANLSVIENKSYDEYLAVENVISINIEQRKRCVEYGAKYFEVLNSYEEDISSAYKWLDGQYQSKINLKFNN